jgi:proteasome accessory factor A
MMQIVLAMLESGYVNMERILDDPLEAVVHWSHGADLEKRCLLVNRESVTAVELQRGYLADARVAFEAGVLDTVPRADEIIDLWAETLGLLAAGDLEALAGRLDWVLKLHAIEHCLSQRPELDWDSPEIKFLEQIYSSLDPADGLYWAYEQSGLGERLVTDEEIEAFVSGPPTDTRAWTRAMLLRALAPEDIDDIDWHLIEVSRRGEDGLREIVRVSLGDPLGGTRADNEPVFSSCETTEQILNALCDGAREPDGGKDEEEDEEDAKGSQLRVVTGSAIH